MDDHSPKLYLASRSPQRKRLLKALRNQFTVLDSQVDETPIDEEHAQDYVLRLADLKARAGFRLVDDRIGRQCVVGADTCVVLDGAKFGKPADPEDAMRMLKMLRGRTHQVYSAVSVHCGDLSLSTAAITHVEFSELTDTQLEQFIDSGESQGRAGSYGIQGKAAQFISRLEGSWSCVVGLPVRQSAEFIVHCGFRVPSYDETVSRIQKEFGEVPVWKGQYEL